MGKQVSIKWICDGCSREVAEDEVRTIPVKDGLIDLCRGCGDRALSLMFVHSFRSKPKDADCDWITGTRRKARPGETAEGLG